MSLTKLVHEGEQTSHTEILNEGESIKWNLGVSDGYDICISIRTHSMNSVAKSTWTISNPQRTKESSGIISYRDLQEDNIPLPVQIEFQLDNTYSWFSPKECTLDISREKENNTMAARDSPVPRLNKSISRSSSVSTPESVIERRVSEMRSSIDLLWMKHVIDEALNRCPEQIPQLRENLLQVKLILDNQPIISSPVI